MPKARGGGLGHLRASLSRALGDAPRLRLLWTGASTGGPTKSAASRHSFNLKFKIIAPLDHRSCLHGELPPVLVFGAASGAPSPS